MLRRGEELSICAEAWLERGEVVVRLFPPAPPALAPPQAIINYVKRTRERVILGEAVAPWLFGSDDPASSRRPRSALCLPILRQGELVALLYLENNLARNAFSADRMATLDLLASQAAISLENARLYSEVKEEIRERKQAEAAASERAAALARSEQALHAKSQLLQSIITSMGEDELARHAAGRRREESRSRNLPDSTEPPPLEMSRRKPGIARAAPSTPAAWRHAPMASGSS
jgi:GAF domain-containing protein